MRSLLLVPVAALLLAIGACNTTRTAAQDDRFGGTGTSDSLFFSMERTPCFGKCPVYKINVYRSGYATYSGTQNTGLLGDHAGHIGADTLALLLARAESIGFFGFQDKYDGQVTDLPSTIVRVVSKERDKRVVGRVKVPPAFKEFVFYAEGLLLKAPWKPVSTQH